MNSSVSICVANFYYPIVEVYNRVSTLIHYIMPFAIQVTCTILLLILTARSRSRTMTTGQNTFRQVFTKQLSPQKELFVTPTVIIFSALPQTILTFSLACTQLSGWKRHTLLTAILLTYMPQVLGFILYVLPSRTYTKEDFQNGRKHWQYQSGNEKNLNSHEKYRSNIFFILLDNESSKRRHVSIFAKERKLSSYFLCVSGCAKSQKNDETSCSIVFLFIFVSILKSRN
ncbi:unnamed protein product [Adineta ricciae]|uniref:G protein-coupled receptor n=1 Tax=Adineta ricciae TaxID=249248 RepID=A0A815QTD6_ADIRI|nr:unnamed protein product [Adineta ricciae]CAF1467669.1 unnamed protein product [Adineta ricciae]